MKQQIEQLKRDLLEKIEYEDQQIESAKTAATRTYHEARRSAFGWCYNEIVYMLIHPDAKPEAGT